MIYSISGKVICIEGNIAVIESSGIGYACKVSGKTSRKLTEKNEVTLFTKMSVKENAIELYGFLTKEERISFDMLCSVSGIGGKSALSLLSELSPEEFALSVASEDTKTLSSVKGISQKSASRIILELKGKLEKKHGSLLGVDSSLKARESSMQPLTGNYAEAVSALTVLGYSPSAARDALIGVDTSMSSPELIKIGLKNLYKRQ